MPDPMILDAPQHEALTRLRRTLHARPELSGEEGATAAVLRDHLAATAPDLCLTGLGGHGLALGYGQAGSGPTVMFRAELDALPITEATGAAHASTRPGTAHLCGHDGHMAILAGLARHLAAHRPARGRAVLLFQPAEETGAGARAVLADPRFAEIAPDWAFALHNMPGLPLGRIAVAPGPASCASLGLHVRWQGRTAHAAQPETGLSPAPALAALLAGLPAESGSRMATLCHLSMGARGFGVAPGAAEAMMTLRCITDAELAAFEAETRARIRATAGDLRVEITRHDHFHATQNDPEATAHVVQAARSAGIARTDFTFPMRPSEDFGAFSGKTRAALFLLGAGSDHPALHDPEYDFPDALIAPGVATFAQLCAHLLPASTGSGA